MIMHLKTLKTKYFNGECKSYSLNKKGIFYVHRKFGQQKVKSILLEVVKCNRVKSILLENVFNERLSTKNYQRKTINELSTNYQRKTINEL